MTKAILTVDLDDCVWDFNNAFIPFANSQLGTNVTFEGHTSYEFSKVYGLPQEEVMAVGERFCHTEALHDSIEVMEWVHTALTALQQDFNLPGLTSRCESIRYASTRLRSKLNLHMLEDLYFTNATTRLKRYQKRKKSEFVLELGALLHFDDAIKNAVDVTSVGVPVILIDRPWNAGPLPEHTYRVGDWRKGRSGWDEVPDLVYQLLG